MSAAPLGRRIDPDTLSRQSRAADPKTSAWVTANAGSGKTHVLTQRVIRLLLEGVDPSKILCLTFTKAAAANMSTRVFKTLATWTTLADHELRRAVQATGANELAPGALVFARKLFARTIETPGGLKIQTIHAFCERLLHLFPFEANAPAGFRVLDDAQAAELLEAARATAIAEGEHRLELAAAIRTIASRAGADGFDALVGEALSTRAEIEAYGDADAYGLRLTTRLGLDPNETEEAIDRELLAGGGGPAQWKAWAKKLRDGAKTDAGRAGELAAAAATPGDALSLDLLKQAFFNKDLTPTKQLTTAGLRKLHPELEDELRDEQDRLNRLFERRRSAAAVTRSVALVRVAKSVLSAYRRLKNAQGALDFADLVERALALVEKADAAWVLYKLDKGIEHFLVDEAQDTSRAQWAILERLADEFLSGEGAGSKRRTFFAVGDEKQSIFSFQGAEPALFDEMRRGFMRRHDAVEKPFSEVLLHLSFRSAPRVLAAVDLVFSQDQAWRGVSAAEAKAPPHGAHHADMPGSVEIWDPIRPEATPDPVDWRQPLDAQSGRDPPVRLAERIAELISSWLAPNSAERLVDPLTGLARRIRASDILILVRKRGPFYEAMARALRRRRLAFAGADRLKLRDHMAALDLVSAGCAALYRDDDLALAEVLKSPLIGLDDEALIELAPQRPGSLADALAASRFAGAAARLDLWRERAKTLSPFDFYARLIGADGGRRALIARLGAEAADAIDEFLAMALAFERETSPSLSAFLDEISESEADIKREAEAEAAGVRVMTVHAAKGLEAAIVFLPDTMAPGRPHASREPRWLAFEGAGLRVWAGARAEDSPPLSALRNAVVEIAEGEHRRLLYVAMTRAAHRLIVCGAEGARGAPPDCWHTLIRGGLEPALTALPAPWSKDETVWRFADSAPVGETVAAGQGGAPAAAPPWLSSPAAAEPGGATLLPSRASGPRRHGPEPAGRDEGRLAHALIEKLPEIAPAARAAAAAKFLDAQGGSLEPARRAVIAERALGLIADPGLADLFGPQSRAEVAISGELPRRGAPGLAFAGRIDRLAVGPDSVEIVDFKSGGRSGRAAYVAQIALYVAALRPLYDRPVRASILWLEDAEREPISDFEIDAALNRLL